MEPEQEASDRQRYLRIYLQDHRAGAEAGVRLAGRCHDHAPDAATAAELAQVHAEIEEDRRALTTIMAGLEIAPSTAKTVAGVAGERVGRLKLNGRLVRRSPLSIVVELEGLIGAVSVKRQLWATLLSMTADGRTADPRLDELKDRAEDQRRRLEAIHGRLVRQLFAPAATPVTAPHSSSDLPTDAP